MNNENSMSNHIRQIIETQYKKDKEIFKEKPSRNNFKNATLDSLGINNEKGKNLYSQVYKKFLKRKKLYNNDYTETRFRRILSPEFKNVKITAEPQGEYLEPVKTPVEKIKEEIIQDHPRLSLNHQPEINSDLEHMEEISNYIPEESIAHFWDGVWILFKLKWSQIEGLNDEERQSLGKMWRPFFEKYTSEKFIILGIPAIVTLGMFGKHIIKGRQIKKQLEQEEAEKTNQKTEVHK